MYAGYNPTLTYLVLSGLMKKTRRSRTLEKRRGRDNDGGGRFYGCATTFFVCVFIPLAAVTDDDTRFLDAILL